MNFLIFSIILQMFLFLPGPFNDTADVYIFIITTENIVTFLFQNPRNEVLANEKRVSY